MSSTSLAQLRSRVLERANMEGSGSDFVTEVELDAIINGEAGELHDLVVSENGDQFTTNLQFVLNPGESTYTIAGAVYQLRGVDRLDAGEWVPLHKSDWASRGRKQAGLYTPWRQSIVQYRLVGQVLYLTPTDTAAGQYRLWYVPGYDDLVDDMDFLTYPNQWVETIIAGAAAKLLAKEESDPSVQLGLKASLTQRIMASAGNRDVSAPERVERVRRRYRDDEDD